MSSPEKNQPSEPRIAPSPVCAEQKDTGAGVGLFATQNHPQGAQIASFGRPLVASLDAARTGDTCAVCFTWVSDGSGSGSRLYVREDAKVSRCGGCKRVSYCSKACQKEAWGKGGHKHLCQRIRDVGGEERGIPKAALACMEVLCKRARGLVGDKEWEALLRLPVHEEGFREAGKWAGVEGAAKGIRDVAGVGDGMTEGVVAGLYARILANSLTLITPTLDPLGIMCSPMMSNLNHSCDPNAYVMMNGPEAVLRSLKPIKKDEELFIAYIDTTNPFRRRQRELKERWFFTCQCTKCAQGATLDEDKFAIAPQDLAQELKDAADVMISAGEAFTKDLANAIGDNDTVDERRVAAIQGKAFDEQAEAQHQADATEASKRITNAMRLCHQSKLWPLYRQPYAALRDDLIVNLLSAGQFVVAFAQCARRYRYILPKLYPAANHPVRVVQTWQMAMLAAYLAGSPEGVGSPEVNMGLVAVMLVKQVLDVVSLSHGPENVFSLSVMRKAEEMSAELRRAVGGNPDTTAINSMLEEQRMMLMQMGDWVQY